MSDPQIPHDADAEQVILGNCLLSESAAPLEELSEAGFHSQDNRRIFGAIRALVDSAKPVNLLEVTRWLQEHGNSVPPAYVSSLTDGTPILTPETLQYYRGRLDEARQKRAALQEVVRMDMQVAAGAGMEEIRESALRIVAQTAPKPIGKKQKRRYLEPPEAAWHGVTKIYRLAMQGTSEAPDVFHLAGFLTVAGALLGKSVCVGTDQDDYLFPNLYTVLVGDSGSCKDRAAKRGIAALRRCDNQVFIPTTISSIEGFIGELSQARKTLEEKQVFCPFRVLLRLSELRDMIEKANQKGAGNIVPKLCIAYDCPDELSVPTRNNPVAVREPAVSILASTTPDWMQDISLRDLRGGLGSRVLFVAGDPKPPHRRSQPPDPSCSQAVRERVDQLRVVFPLSGVQVFPFSAAAEDRLDKWYIQHKSLQSDDPLIKFLAVRDVVHVYKVSLLHAALDLVSQIELFHVEAAIAFVDFLRDLRTTIFEGHGFSPTQVAQAAIERIIKERGEVGYSEALKLFSRYGDAILFKRLVDSLALSGGPIEVRVVNPKRPKRFLLWRG